MLGPNGAGKTTAVRILTTLLLPDQGRALVEGRDVVREAAAVRRSIGLSGQSAAIQEELTGRENRGRTARERPPRPPPAGQEGQGHGEGGVMTAVVVPAAEPGLLTRTRWAVSDTLTITRRNLLVWIRVPAYIVFTVIQPVMFVLLFVYVFGGAIPIPGGSYVDFLMPGIIAQTAAFASFGTAIALAQELQKGVIDRLRSMPMARSAVLAGRLVADTGRMLITILIIVGVGYAVGFRAIGDEESVQAFGLIWLFPLTFVSSAFVPVATMPGWMQAFANHQPVTYVVNAMRALALGGPIAADLWWSIAWLAGIFIVFAPLAVRAYRRAS